MEDIKNILRSLRRQAILDNDSNLDSLELDSMDIMELISQLEKKFEISIFAEDVIPENFTTVRTIAKMLSRNGVAAATLGL